MSVKPQENIIFEVPEMDPESPQPRIDAYVASKIDCFSRSQLSKMIDDGLITVNGEKVLRKLRLEGLETISVTFATPESSELLPVEMELNVYFEDEHLAVINKPAGLVVHPGAGTKDPTLVNGLLFKYPDIKDVGDPHRPGIVHRLDKDTSGCMIIAKTEQARLKLIDLFSNHKVFKEYYAIVKGSPKWPSLKIEKPIGRNRKDRKKMSIDSRNPRPARSNVRYLYELGAKASALAVEIVTGRTHQIRVHLSDAKFPIIGDDTYGNGAKHLAKAAKIERQMLHAWKLIFEHPITKQEIKVTAPLPEDMKAAKETLEAIW